MTTWDTLDKRDVVCGDCHAVVLAAHVHAYHLGMLRHLGLDAVLASGHGVCIERACNLVMSCGGSGHN